MNLSKVVVLLTFLLPLTMARIGSANAVASAERMLKDNTQGNARIIGGEPALPNEFPFFVDFGDCGGTLIHDDIVLSAAHCAGGVRDDPNVYINSYVEDRGVDRQIVTHRVHPKYDNSTNMYDVMVLKIDSPTSHPPVVLHDGSFDLTAGENLTAIGHGVTNISNPYEGSYELRKVMVPFIPHDKCAADIDAIEDLPAQLVVDEDVMLCAGFDEGQKDACSGDSGGPLLKRDGDSYVQVGITSWGDDCANPNSPGIYTRVSGVKGWIDKQICALSDNPPEGCEATGKADCQVNDDPSIDDCPPDSVVVRAVPPNNNTQGFDWEADSTAIYYDSLEKRVICQRFIYQNDNGIRYNLIADQELQCPQNITIETTGEGIEKWDPNVTHPTLTFTESSLNNGKFYCSYETNQDFAVHLETCLERQSGQTSVLVEITYDEYPYENGWTVTGQNGTVFFSLPTGSATKSGFTSERIYLFPGEYIFNITDTYGDGIFSDDTNETWKISAELAGEDPVLAQGGSFNYNHTATFTVPSESGGGTTGPTSSPTTTSDRDIGPTTTSDKDIGPTTTSDGFETNTSEGMETNACQDSATETFLVDNVIGDQDCSWLVDNQDRFDFLCRFIDVALACRKTCDICDLP